MHQEQIVSTQTLVRIITLLLMLVSLALTSGCVRFISSAGVTSAISLISSASSSEILSSPFRSSSRQPDEKEKKEVEDETIIYVMAFLAAEASDNNNFQKGLSDIAARHGINDWEACPHTWMGVGRGLASAGLSEKAATTVVDFWSIDNPDGVTLLMQAYAATRARDDRRAHE